MCQKDHVEQVAHAKLTLRLHITGVRHDGYHLIDAEMVTVDLCDRLTFSSGDGIELMGPASSGISTGPDNLVSKALRLAQRCAHVRIDKAIPAGGGLGGGSADAAAVLRWAGVHDPLIAARVGADVPFCLMGGRARVRGVGEILEPLPHCSEAFTLLMPPFGIDTAAVYAAYDQMQTRGTRALLERNHLQAAAIMVEPRLKSWRAKLGELTSREPALAGSGSTWFVEGAWPKPADKVLEGGRWIVATTTHRHAT